MIDVPTSSQPDVRAVPDDVRWSYAQVGDACPDRHGQLRCRAVRVYWPRTQSHVVKMGRASAGWRDRHADQTS
eukprot:scaffold5299_cov108-Isochrysis_galbana.AAC.1